MSACRWTFRRSAAPAVSRSAPSTMMQGTHVRGSRSHSPRVGVAEGLFRPNRVVAAVSLAVAVAMLASPAQARVFIGFGFPLFGPPLYYPPPAYYPPPPAYYPPPTYYAPPPVASYAPPQAPHSGYPSGEGQTCYAGAYTCPMDRSTASGAPCYCLGNGGQRVTGRAN